MLLALPVQGMAQASMFACHLNGNSSSAGQAIDHSTMHHSEMNHDGMDTACTTWWIMLILTRPKN